MGDFYGELDNMDDEKNIGEDLITNLFNSEWIVDLKKVNYTDLKTIQLYIALI